MTYIGSLEILLLLVEAVLNYSSAGEQTLLQAAQGFVLDLDGGLLLERDARIVVSALLEDGHELILGLLLLLVVLIVLLAHAHLVTSLSIDGLLEDAAEDVLLVLGGALLVDGLLAFGPLRYLS